MEKQAFLHYDTDAKVLQCGGHWSHRGVDEEHYAEISAFFKPSKKITTVDASAIESLDTYGAYLLLCLCRAAGISSPSDLSTDAKTLFEQVSSFEDKVPQRPFKDSKNVFWHIGKGLVLQVGRLLDFFNFIGEFVFSLPRSRRTIPPLFSESLFKSVLQTGIHALPIIALLSFLVGVVLAYQMGDELRRFGANVYIVDLVGVSIFREFAPLMTAIILAGRTSAAYTAELGTMRMNEEIDALLTLGISPQTALVLPRILGLLVSLPLLAVWSDFFGVLGGMMMAALTLDISSIEFLLRFKQEIPMSAYLLGLSKTPVFAMIIGSVGCFQGLQVKNTAEEVGQRTTMSVVQAIF